MYTLTNPPLCQWQVLVSIPRCKYFDIYIYIYIYIYMYVCVYIYIRIPSSPPLFADDRYWFQYQDQNVL